MSTVILDTDILSEYLRGIAAHVKARAKHQGRTVELPDCLIAAVAARLGFPLVTGNTADYKGIQETGLALTLQNWREP